MTDEKEDLRVKITKQLLYDALFDLVRENRFEQISVTDICNEAEVHRTTFYKHFENKYELLDYCINELCDDFSDMLTDNQYDSLDEFYQIVKNGYITHIFGDDSLFIEILSNNKNGVLIDRVYDIVIDKITKNLKENLPKREFKGIPAEIIVEYYVGASFRVYRYWLINPDFCTKNELVSYLDKLIF